MFIIKRREGVIYSVSLLIVFQASEWYNIKVDVWFYCRKDSYGDKKAFEDSL